MKPHFQMFAAYNSWANARIYQAARDLDDDSYRRDVGAFFSSLHGTLNHILLADRVWMKRFTGQGSHPNSLDAILYTDFDELSRARVEDDERIARYINDLSPEAFEGRFTYTRVDGIRTISQRLCPALTHFFNHQTHHRGQAHGILSCLGAEPPSLDMVQFFRAAEGLNYA